MSELLKEAFSTCIVLDGNIMFMGKRYSTEQLRQLYFEFSRDLLNRQIPHYRVIGIYHEWDDRHEKSVFRNNDMFGQSLIELSEKAQWLIPEKMGGNDPEKGCFYGEDENIENNQSFNEAYGWSPSGKISTKRANLLRVPEGLSITEPLSSVIGSLAIDEINPKTEEPITRLNTNNVWYTQHSLTASAVYPNMLIKNKDLGELKRDLSGKPYLFFFFMRGKGELSYADTQKFFKADFDKIMPCNAIYDLSKFFTCAIPKEGDSCLRLVYHEPFDNINEEVLTTILNEYGKEL